MATYIKRFDTTTQYTTYMAGDPYLPNVSMCEDIIDSPSMHYTPFIPVSGVTLDKSEASVTVNGSTTLTATIIPLDASKKAVTWTSSDTSKVTIDGTGSTVTLTCIGIGSSTITCTSVSDPSISATCSVTVTAIAVTGITLSSSSKTLNVGSTTTLTATITPSNATNKNVTWRTSNSSKVSVAPNGTTATLYFVGVGSSTITCASVSDPSVKATCACTVNKIAVTGVTVSPSTTTVNKGSTTTLTATVTPSNATNKNVTWTSNNESVATVTQNGVVTGIGEGTATIKAISQDNANKYGTCNITVLIPKTVTVKTTRNSIDPFYNRERVITQDYGLNDYGYNLYFSIPLEEGDELRVKGRILAEVYKDNNNWEEAYELKSFDIRGTIGAYVAPDPAVIVASDYSGFTNQILEVGNGDLYGTVYTPYATINSPTPLYYNEGTYLDYYYLEIWVNGVKYEKISEQH